MPYVASYGVVGWFDFPGMAHPSLFSAHPWSCALHPRWLGSARAPTRGFRHARDQVQAVGRGRTFPLGVRLLQGSDESWLIPSMFIGLFRPLLGSDGPVPPCGGRGRARRGFPYGRMGRGPTPKGRPGSWSHSWFIGRLVFSVVFGYRDHWYLTECDWVWKHPMWRWL
jgi:hypothetical protein